VTGVSDGLVEVVEITRELIDMFLRVETDAVDLKDIALEINSAVGLLTGGVVQSERPELIDPVTGQMNALALPLTMEPTDEGVRADLAFPYRFQGPLGLLHGGIAASILERALAEAASAAGPEPAKPVSQAITVRYHHPVPLFTESTLSARVSQRGVLLRAEGTISIDGVVHVSAIGDFVIGGPGEGAQEIDATTT
jgi:acyl-coenzyme A thioesterase PaaI-like protein